MPQLYSSKQITKFLEEYGFVFTKQTGSHMKFRNQAGLTVIVPANKKIIKIGTWQSILRQANVTKQMFEAFFA